MTELAPLDGAALPAGIRSRFVPDINGLHARAGGRFETAGRPACCCCTVFRSSPIPGARSCCRSPLPAFMSSRPISAAMAAPPAGTPTTMATCARSDSEHGPGCAGAGLGARPSLGRGGRRPRFRRAGRGVVRAGAARCVPLGGADERAVRRPAGIAVRHSRPAAARRARATSTRRWQSSAAAQALSMVLLDAARQCRHVALPAGRARLSARLFPSQERGLAATSRSGCNVDRRRTGEDADLLHHGSAARRWRRPWRRDAVSRGDRRVPMAARQRTRGLQPPNTSAPGSRAACKWYRARTGGSTPPNCNCFPAATIDVPSMFIAGSSDWGIYQRPGAFERMQRTPARGCSAATWSTAPAIGCSRSSRNG